MRCELSAVTRTHKIHTTQGWSTDLSLSMSVSIQKSGLNLGVKELNIRIFRTLLEKSVTGSLNTIKASEEIIKRLMVK